MRNSTYYYNEGLKDYHLKQYYTAIKYLDKAIESNPDYLYAYFFRGDSCRELKQYGKALNDFRYVIKNENNIYAYDAQRYSDEIIKLCEKNIKDINNIIKKREPGNKNNYSYFMLGYWYKITDRLDRAIINYNNLIMLYNDAAAYYCRHSCHYERGKRSGNINDFTKALDDLAKTIQLDPNNIMAYFALGHYYRFYMKDHDKTTKCYNKLIEFYKKNNEYKKSRENDKKIATIYFMLGICNYHQGIYGKKENYPEEKEYFQTALSYFKKANNIDPDSATIYAMLNNCYIKLNNSRKRNLANKN